MKIGILKLCAFQISALSRWEIIDVIRTLSTQAAKAKANSSDTERENLARDL